MGISRTGLALFVSGYMVFAGGCGAKTFARLKDFNHYMTSAERKGDGWYDLKTDSRKFLDANGPDDFARGLDNAGVDIVNFFIPDNYHTPASSTENVSVSKVEDIAAK